MIWIIHVLFLIFFPLGLIISIPVHIVSRIKKDFGKFKKGGLSADDTKNSDYEFPKP